MTSRIRNVLFTTIHRSLAEPDLSRLLSGAVSSSPQPTHLVIRQPSISVGRLHVEALVQAGAGLAAGRPLYYESRASYTGSPCLPTSSPRRRSVADNTASV